MEIKVYGKYLLDSSRIASAKTWGINLVKN